MRLTVDELKGLPDRTIVRDMDDGELGRIEPCIFGAVPRNKILWDNGCISVILPKTGAGLNVERVEGVTHAG